MLRLKNLNWLWAATGFTIVYLGVIGWWIGLDRLLTFLSRPQLNEFGDFIAGVFAPLAFIWLVAAVLTQRQELDQTKQEFKENNEFVAGQLVKAEDSARRTYRLELFPTRYEIYNEVIAFHDLIKSKDKIQISDCHIIRKIAEKSAFVFGQNVSTYLDGVADHCFQFAEKFEDNDHEPDGDPISKALSIVGPNIEAFFAKDKIEKLVSMETIKKVMWSSLNVSDQ